MAIRSTYGDTLLNWLNDEGFGSNKYLASVFKSNASDDIKYQFALAFYDGVTKKSVNKVKEGEEWEYLVPEECGDGSFRYVNKMTGQVEAMVDRMPNGLFSFYGKSKWRTMLGGRGDLSAIVDRMADGKYFNKN